MAWILGHTSVRNLLCGDRGGGSRESRSKRSDVRALSAMMLRRNSPFSLSAVSQEALFVLNLAHTCYSSRTIPVCCRLRKQKTSRISDYHLKCRIEAITIVLQACGMNYDTLPFLDHVVVLLERQATVIQTAAIFAIPRMW